MFDPADICFQRSALVFVVEWLRFLVGNGGHYSLGISGLCLGDISNSFFCFPF